MPPVKTPKPKPERDATAILVLTTQNLDEMRRWYRGATYPGHEVGHVIAQEMALDKVLTALTYAIEGRRWEAPANTAP